MKTTLLFIIGLSLSAAAQQTPFVHDVVRKTNVIHVAASTNGVVATQAHDAVTIAEIAAVGVIEKGQFKPFDQPAIRLVSQTTNLVDKAAQAQKPLLSTARQLSAKPAPKAAIKPAKIPGTNAPHGALYEPPQNVDTNSPAYRRAHKLPPFNK